MNEVLKQKLLAMIHEDEEIRLEIIQSNGEDEEITAKMDEVQARNSMELRALIQHFGWPGESEAGEDGAEAAWLILQHSVAVPELLREALPMMQEAADGGEILPYQVAYLEDRICFFERRPQKFGTQFDWDDEGKLSPWPIENEKDVTDLRREKGLNSLEEQTEQMRARLGSIGQIPPKNPAQRREAMTEWSREVGWLE